MSFSHIVTIVLMGLISNNMITVSGIGVDMAMNRLNTIKNAAIYGLIISIVILTSTIANYFIKMLLIELNIEEASFLITLFVIASIVQICESVCERIAPRFTNEIKYFVPLLASTCAIVVLNINVFIEYTSFFEMTVTSISYSLGIVLVLLGIAGLQRSIKYKNIPYGLERVVLSMLILFILVLAFTAFR